MARLLPFPTFFGLPQITNAVNKRLTSRDSLGLNRRLCSLEKNVDSGTLLPLRLVNTGDAFKEAGMVGTPRSFCRAARKGGESRARAN